MVRTTMKVLFTSFMIMMSGSSAWAAAVALNNAGTMVVVAASTYSGSFSVTAGSNLAAVAVVTYGGSGGAISTVTYNGVSMTLVGTAAFNATSNFGVALYCLINPSTGSNTLAITGNGSVTSIHTNVVSFKNVSQTACARTSTYTSATGSSTHPAVTVTSNTSDLTISAMTSGNGSANYTATTQTLDSSNNSGIPAASDHATTAAASVTHTYTVSASGNWAAAGFSVQNVTAASAIRHRVKQD